MRIPIDSTVDDALPPPPYTAYEADQAVTPDYTPSESVEDNALPIRTGLRSEFTGQFPSQNTENSSLSSNAAYFEQRRFLYDHAGPELDLLEHNIHFDSGFTPTRLPFPRPSDTYLSRDVSGQDWATFVNCLFPIGEENHKEKTKAGSKEKRSPADHLDSPERREKIQAVIAEWNAGFFAPRLIRVTAHFESLSPNRLSRSLAPQSTPNGAFSTRDLSQYQETIYHGPTASGHPLPSPSILGPGPANLEPPRSLRHSSSKSSISSSSSSSSDSSVDSISSKDLNHATLPEIRALIDAFRADPHKKNHLRKSVREFRHQLRTQHLPCSSSDPYNSKATKAEKKAYKDQRKILKKEIAAAVKEAINDRKADRQFRKILRKNRKDARKHERREIKQCRREEKHARRDEKRSSRDLKRSQKHHPDQPPPFATRTTSWPHAPLALARARSTEAVALAQVRSTDAVAAARTRADAAREAAHLRADAVRESARMVGVQVRDRAAEAGRRVENSAANVGANVESWSAGVGERVESVAASVGERVEGVFTGRRTGGGSTAAGSGGMGDGGPRGW